MEISPATEAPIKSILYYQDSPWLTSEELTLMSSQNGLGVSSAGVANDKDSVGKQSGTSSVHSSDRGRKYSLSFDGLEPGQTYKLIFSSEIDGRTIMQTIRNYECTNDDTSSWKQ